jgi:LuxR family maltose regulon positive regulatory protein
MKGIELCKQWHHQAHLLEGYLLLVHVQISRGKMKEAMEAFAEVEQLMKDPGSVQLETEQMLSGHQRAWLVDAIDVTRAQIWLASGDLASVARWIHERGLNSDDHALSFLRGYVTMTWLLFAQQKYNQAMQLSERLLVLTEQQGLLRGTLELLILQTLLFNAQGNVARALSILQQALSLAEPEGYIRIFADHSSVIAGLLQQIASRKIAGDYVQALLRACSKVTTPPRLSSPLSGREREILRLLASGMSNREIAEALVITVGTVKWYVNSIYGKLQVSSRTQAVARARAAGLLPS